MVGSNKSPLLKSFLDGYSTHDVKFEFEINVIVFDKPWLLTEGIYPDLGCFVKTLDEAVGHMSERYGAWQEPAQKDIKRTFGILQQKFQILVKKFE
jgi:hypothetical protein